MDLVVFDIDGTLTRTNKVDSECFVETIREVLGLEEFETDWTKYQFVTDSGVAQEISHQYRERPLTGAEMKRLDEVMIRRLGQEDGTQFQQVPGSAEFLQGLEESSRFAVAIATGASQGSARLKLEMAGISVGEIPLASSSDAVVREHIMMQAMDRASHRHKTPFSRVTYFGDAPWDVDATGNLGWDLIGIGPGIDTPNRFDDYSDPEAILRLL
ncbi:MAG: HAD family hydrolase [Akkermansiaceae bacterium]